jgi:hypothetical protein
MQLVAKALKEKHKLHADNFNDPAVMTWDKAVETLHLVRNARSGFIQGERLMVDKANFDCYSCIYRESVPGDAHSACRNSNAKVAANPHGIKMGWFMWPWNFDPVWLTSCNGYKRRTGIVHARKSQA